MYHLLFFLIVTRTHLNVALRVYGLWCTKFLTSTAYIEGRQYNLYDPLTDVTQSTGCNPDQSVRTFVLGPEGLQHCCWWMLICRHVSFAIIMQLIFFQFCKKTNKSTIKINF